MISALWQTVAVVSRSAVLNSATRIAFDMVLHYTEVET